EAPPRRGRPAGPHASPLPSPSFTAGSICNNPTSSCGVVRPSLRSGGTRKSIRLFVRYRWRGRGEVYLARAVAGLALPDIALVIVADDDLGHIAGRERPAFGEAQDFGHVVRDAFTHGSPP